MIYGSICSGIEAATVAWHPLGWKASFFSEIEKFPREVLAHHYPDVPLLGNVNDLYVDIDAKILYSMTHGEPEKRLSRSVKSVSQWTVCPECGGFLWRDKASHVGLVEAARCSISSERAKRKRESFFSRRGDSIKTCNTFGRKGNNKGSIDKAEPLRNVRQKLCSCEWEAANRGASQGLYETTGGGMVVPEMSSQMAQEPNGNPRFIDISDIDVLVGGFPCQDLSIAGKRRGFTDEHGKTTRSGLFYRIAELADAIGQRWTVLENVPGLLSSNCGEDFAAVVGTLCGDSFPVPKDGWKNAGFAAGHKGLVEWFVLDAQYFGVAQRRRRVFIVRDSGNWPDRPPILPFPTCLQGNPLKGGEERQKITEDVAKCLTSRGSGCQNLDLETSNVVVCPTLTSNGDAHSGFRDERGLVVCPINTQMALRGAETSNTSREGIGVGDVGDPSFTLQRSHSHAVAIGWSEELTAHENLAGTIQRGGQHDGVMTPQMQVRRLTPIECERLQGFPDFYTKISDKTADGARYKALGNSMAVPVMAWIGKRIQMIEDTK